MGNRILPYGSHSSMVGDAMKPENILPGMVLRLKPERQKAYALDNPLVAVTELKPHKHYKRTWICAGAEFYLPQDFLRREP